ncbi:HAMP domain-containing sensor histidine kinase [Sphingobium sp. DC-2]|uniref:HAMP domain-containing sensor histidine kinase n=1 Tax=Sphingobium sp. DC-2 TaxID=1303256 RepID=UPI00068A010E|nr:HAMP domain-containing sensor histidine kinase [Sphingobium sp. DC-2]
MISFQSLRALTLAFLIFFLSATLATAVGTYFATMRTIDHMVVQRISGMSEVIAPDREKVSARGISRRIMAAAHDRDTADLGFILLERGRQIAGNVRVSRPLPLGLSNVDLADKIKGLSHGRVLVRDLGDGLRLAVIAETEPFDNYNAARKRIYILGFGSIILVALAAATTFTLIIRQRIIEMRRTVDAIFEGDLSQRVPGAGSRTAFGKQAQAFNRMLDRINNLMDEVRNVTNGVAHELRTPLARLRNHLTLIGHDPRAAPLRDRIGEAQAQADGLLSLFSALLRIAEIDSGARRENFAAVDLAALTAECAEALEAVLEESGHRIRLSLQPVILNGDPQLLSQMIINLVENAVRHTPAGSEIRLSLTAGASSDRATLIVADNGPGIAPADRQRALDRFGRLSGEGEIKGHGFGLPLVASIVRLHGGSIELGDAQPGLKVIVSLPIA